MVQICPLHAIFSVSGALWSNLVKKQMTGAVKFEKFDDYRVEIIMADGTKYPRNGKIIFVDSSEDNLTSSVSIKAEIPSDENQKLLLPGQFVRVKVVGAEYQNVVVVPASALISTHMGYVVYVVPANKVVNVRPVKAEIIGNEALIESGLQEGEIVVSEGIVKTRPGQPVNAVLKPTTAGVPVNAAAAGITPTTDRKRSGS
jgi:membrane fusion protein (multidrug efflux system)